MAFNSPTGFLCYNNKDLIRDGYIYKSLSKEYDPDDFVMAKLKTRAKGVTYVVEKDENGNIIKIIEKRRQLPASKIKLEIIFSKVLKNALSPILDPGTLAGFGQMGAGSIFNVGMGLLPLSGGGITSGITQFTYHLCDAETKINIPITVTEEIKDTGIIEFDDYPLSVFGIVKEQVVKDENGAIVEKYGIQFTDKEIEILGRFSSGIYEGAPRVDISGATDSKGLYGGVKDPDVKIEEILKRSYSELSPEDELQEQLFIEIIRDTRTYKFRGDNSDASGDRSFPFASSSLNDITDRYVRIKTDSIEVGDILYITYSIAPKRRVRRCLRHKGSIFQDNAYGMFAKQAEINSVLDVFDFQICEWYVPKLDPSFPYGLIEDNEDIKYKITLDQYIDLKKNIDEVDNYDIIEGWRLSESITSQTKAYWAADYRGIIYVDAAKNQVIVVLARDKIRDQNWFNLYLESLPFDEGDKIEDKIEIKELSDSPFDIGEPVNTLLFDREKIPYYKQFALALNNVSQYDKSDSTSGVGVPNLDLILNGAKEYINTIPGAILSNALPQFAWAYSGSYLEYIDLSFSFFNWTRERTLKSYSCQDDFDVLPGHYSCHTYDPVDGPGVFFSIGYIENQFLEWRPPGGFIESYWKLDTPYYCGSFTTKSRIYIEKIGGNSINNYSFIYTDTLPDFPDTISLDFSPYVDKAIVSYRDDAMHNDLVYSFFEDNLLKESLGLVKVDKSNSFIKEPFNYKRYNIVGYNNILGDRPSYNYGKPIIDEASKIFFQPYNLLDPAYGFNLADSIPTLTIPSKWNIKEIWLAYNVKDNSIDVDKMDKEIALYFSNKNGVLNSINIPISEVEFLPNGTFVDCRTFQDWFILDTAYYSDTVVEFYGDIWKNIDLKVMTGMISMEDEIRDFKIKSSQSSLAFDRNGTILVFYADTETDNISVAISYDMGTNWFKYRNIIRLVGEETASYPLAFTDKSEGFINLFYVLNDDYLMYKKINSLWFSRGDKTIIYEKPLSYDENSKDDDTTDVNSSLYKYSEGGKLLKQSTSYFVFGNARNEYFKKQMVITDAIKVRNLNLGPDDKYMTIRLDCKCLLSQMDVDYRGESYSVHPDEIGLERLFILSENLLYIKTSNDYLDWRYDVKGAEIHKDFFSDGDKGEITEVKNIQVILDYSNSAKVSILYFHKNMLFMRNFNSNWLFNYSGSDNDGNLINYIDINKETTNKPLFLVGNIDNEIINKINDPDLAIDFPSGYKSIINVFNESFNLDTDTQPFAFTTSIGVKRVFFKDSFDNLESISINGSNVVIEAFYEPKGL